jgi:catechol 2,3-dioxygenase-like lactoylglutathione lyase family enzyme
VITGAHFLLYTTDADADRVFLRDVLGFRAVDAGHGWLILGLPPAEMGVHPGDGNFAQTHAGHSMLGALLYLMCDDLTTTIGELAAKGVRCTEVEEAPWGRKTTIPMPSGGEIGLYEPRHPTAI